jgi:hypothetical protein
LVRPDGYVAWAAAEAGRAADADGDGDGDGDGKRAAAAADVAGLTAALGAWLGAPSAE